MKRSSVRRLFALLVFTGSMCDARSQLFDNLQALSDRVTVGTSYRDAPKGLTSGDFDNDGNSDWGVARLDGSIVVAWGNGTGEFTLSDPIVTGGGGLRQLIAADLNGDGFLDLAVAEPFQGRVFLLFSQAGRQWQQSEIETWEGARNLCSADFDGDGTIDLAVAGSDLNPVGPLTGIAQYNGTGGGAFERVGHVESLGVESFIDGPSSLQFPRPVFVLKTWRPTGWDRDALISTNAVSNEITILAADDVTGLLTVLSEIDSNIGGIRAMAIGPVTSVSNSGEPDVIIASRDTGTVAVYQLQGALPNIEAVLHQQLDIPGGPRALDLADLNADGWNELIVASRYAHCVHTLSNDHGTLSVATEAVSGFSPRELATADFDNDGHPDFAVMNRKSFDVSVLMAGTNPSIERTGFRALDQTYPVGGDVGQLALHDLDGDGKDDVLQLHRASADVSVRLAGANGKLGAAVTYPMGESPSSISLGDINRDGHIDLTVANMGDRVGGGKITVRHGDGAGGFTAPLEFLPPQDPIPATSGGGGLPDPALPEGFNPPSNRGRMYAVHVADLDGDGYTDIAAGYYDCRIIFFKGTSTGDYIPTDGFSDHELYFLTAYEARFIESGDFDQDGDLDLALAAWPGDVAVLENTGNFFAVDADTKPYKLHFFERFDNTMAQARDLVIKDTNGDGDLDIIVGTGAGAQILLGKPGMDFERKLFPVSGPEGPSIPVVPSINFPIEAMVTGDFDNDGADDDMATICKTDGCLRIMTKDNGQYTPTIEVAAPLTKYLAVGDVDGDGLPDLAGTGSVLWVALSSRHTATTEPLESENSRPTVSGVVINEVLANNDSIPVTVPGGPADRAYSVDMVELLNNSDVSAPLGGATLTLVSDEGTESFTVPAGTSLSPSGRQIVMFTENELGPWSTGFTLPKEGGTITLSGGDSSQIDEVTYPEAKSDVSYSRFGDGGTTFYLNQLPDPDRPNQDNGAVPPKAEISGVSLRNFAPDEPVRFYATAKDDVGVIGLIIHYRERGSSDPFQKALLYDDGMSSDGGRLDGVFSGVLEPTPAAGTELEFYLAAEDLSGQQDFEPGLPVQEADETSGGDVYTLMTPSVGETTALQISEAVASNSSGLLDDEGKFEDWVEIRNVSNESISLDGIELAESLFDGSPRMVFPSDLVLAPGEYLIVYCDKDDPDEPGILHAPFKISASDGDQIFLISRGQTGAQRIVDSMQVPAGLATDTSWSRIGTNGIFLNLLPSPGANNILAGELDFRFVNTETGIHIAIGYGTEIGQTPKIEYSSDLRTWSRIALPAGDGYEGYVFRSLSHGEYFRIGR